MQAVHNMADLTCTYPLPHGLEGICVDVNVVHAWGN